MCCICISRRGLCYFGASIHIFVALVLFLGSMFRVYRISTYQREENSKHLLGATAIAMYFFTLLVLGCLIFRGVEDRSPKILCWSGGTFITLETFAFVFNLVLLSPMGGAYDEYGLRNFGFTIDVFQILLSLIFLGCMAGYCVVIILYIQKLREDDTGYECAYGEFDDAGTIPAPLINTNLSRSSTVHSNYSVHQNQKNNNNSSQLIQAESHGHASQYHVGNNNSNQTTITGGPQKILMQDRRLQPKANCLSQERLIESNSTFFPQQQRNDLYSTQSHTDAYAMTNQRGCSSSVGAMPYRQSQTLPHSHHYQRHNSCFRDDRDSNLTTATQFLSNGRMDLATLTQTITRNSNVKRALIHPPPSRIHSDPRINHVHHTSNFNQTLGQNLDSWDQPRVQALKYSY